jgi:hypothetical protein
MPSLTAKDRASLCLFSYEDHRRCRTPRLTTHPHFCFYHAQKESQSQAAQKLADDLAYFFSGDYLSANDLNAALARLIPATIRGEIKPRLARTVAYMLQTLMQSTRQAQHEYINAFSTDGWRQSIRHSVNTNHDHLYPPAPASEEFQPSDNADSVDDLQADAQPVADPIDEPQADAQPTVDRDSTVCHPERSEGRRQDPAAPPTDETHHPSTATTRPSPADTEAALNMARNLFPARPNTEPTQPELPETATATAPPASTVTPTQTTQPTNPTPSSRRPTQPTHNPYHYGPEYRLYVDGKPFSKH